MRVFSAIGFLVLAAWLSIGNSEARAVPMGTPPANLPPGSAYLDGPPSIQDIVQQRHFVPRPNYRLYSYAERVRSGNLSVTRSGSKGSVSATPIPIPGPVRGRTYRAR